MILKLLWKCLGSLLRFHYSVHLHNSDIHDFFEKIRKTVENKLHIMSTTAKFLLQVTALIRHLIVISTLKESPGSFCKPSPNTPALAWNSERQGNVVHEKHCPIYTWEVKYLKTARLKSISLTRNKGTTLDTASGSEGSFNSTHR